MNEQTKKIIQVLVIILFLAATIVVVFSMISRGGLKGGMQDNLLSEEMSGLNKEITQEEVSQIKEKANEKCSGTESSPLSGEEGVLCQKSFLAETAMNENAVGICNLLEGQEKTSCLDNVFMKNALEKSDISLCEKLSKADQITACSNEVYFKEAYNNKSTAEEYCNKITVNAIKEICFKQYVNN